MPKDLYDVLGVSRTSSPEEIKKTYRQLAKKFHPDVNKGDKKAEERFKEISQAYDILGDPEKKKKYDQFGSEGGGFDPRHQAHRAYTWSAGGQGGNGGAEFDFGDIFENIFGGSAGAGGARRSSKRRASNPFEAYEDAMPSRDVNAELEIGFEDAVRGVTRRVSLQRNGREEKIDVKIPAGIRDGGKIRLGGKGESGGDLYVQVRVAKHPQFWREEDDVYVDVPVSVTDAVLGGSVRVPTLDGDVTMKIPAGTSSGQKLRLKEKGAPHLGGQGRGDEYAVIKIVVPQNLDEETKELFRKIQAKIGTMA
jgi:curved DNA-binding protein